MYSSLLVFALSLFQSSLILANETPSASKQVQEQEHEQRKIDFIRPLLLPEGFKGQKLRLRWKELFGHQAHERFADIESSHCRSVCGPKGRLRFCTIQKSAQEEPASSHADSFRVLFMSEPQDLVESADGIQSDGAQALELEIHLASPPTHQKDEFWKYWNLEVTAGKMITDDLGEQLTGNLNFDHNTLGLATLGVNYRSYQPLFGVLEDKWWWPRYEAYAGIEWRDDGEKAYPGIILAPITGRWIFPMERWGVDGIDLSLFVREGINYTHEIPETETGPKGQESHRFMNHLGIGFEVGFPGLAKRFSWLNHARLVIWNDHRSDMFGVYPEDGGSNNLLIGFSVFPAGISSHSICRH